MALTEKGLYALDQIKEFYPTDKFTAKQLSDVCGTKIVAATLNSVAKEGYLIKYNTSPIQYEPTSTFLNDIENLKASINIKKSNNDNLHSALKKKDDEYYTYYEDISLECEHYKDFFNNKIIYLNCDDEDSNFWKYFLDNFNIFKLKKLLATHLETSSSYLIETNNGIDIKKTHLTGNGDYSSEECIKLLDQCDIIITNPPFSKSKEFIDLIVKHNKYFLVIGNENAFSSTLIFPLLKNEQVWTGFNKVKKFFNPDNEVKTFGNVCWFTNIPIEKDIPFLQCTKHYNPNEYLIYNNFEAINVDQLKDIPDDYDGIMGVPISYVGKHNPKQFEILGLAAGNTKTNHLNFSVPYTPHPLDRGGCGIVQDNIRKYTRVFIRRRK